MKKDSAGPVQERRECETLCEISMSEYYKKLIRGGELSLISNKVRLSIILFAMLLLVFGYTNNELDDTKHDFSIYLVKDLSTKEAMSKKIDDLPLESVPILTDKEIKTYKWKDHTFYIKDDFSLEQKLEGKVPLDGKPFVFVVDGTRIYLGSFWTPISSLYFPDIPTINSVWSGKVDNSTYTIRYGFEKNDPREDKRIYEALKSMKKLD
jgi:hypothetical protein